MKTTVKQLIRTIRFLILASSFLAVGSTTCFALTIEQKVTPAYVREHPKEWSVKVTKGKDGLIDFTIQHDVASPMYHVAHLAVYHQSKLIAMSDTPCFGKKHGNTFYFSISAEDIGDSKFDLSDGALAGSGDEAVPVPGTTIHQFRLLDFVPEQTLTSARNAGKTARDDLSRKSPQGADGASATSPENSVSRTFTLLHMLASEMADDLRQILLGRVGLEAKPAKDNMQLTVTAPPDVLNRVSTFVFVSDWPKRIASGPDYYYPREDVEQAGRSFFYACSIEDIEGVARMLAPGVLAELKGTNLTAHGVLGEEKDAGLVRQLRGNWEGKEAGVRRVVQAWNRFPLRRLQVEPKISISFGLRYFTSAAFEGAPGDWVELSFVPDRAGGTNGPLMIDTLPPWFPGSR